LSEDGLQHFTKNDEKYKCWNEPKKSGGERLIEAPFDRLKVVQKRIAELLYRIETPDYVISPAKNKSYVMNAAVHRGSKQFYLLDIEDFFPSCRAERVFWFFNKILQCPRDVAAILTKVSTFQGHLPQGSPCSPILAYYAYSDMWNIINKIAIENGCKLTIYVDDITVSGVSFSLRAISQIKSVISKFGLSISLRKERGFVNKAAEITGVIVEGNQIKLPNRQHFKLRLAKSSFSKCKTQKERDYIVRQISGRVAQKTQIESYNI